MKSIFNHRLYLLVTAIVLTMMPLDAKIIQVEDAHGIADQVLKQEKNKRIPSNSRHIFTRLSSLDFSTPLFYVFEDEDCGGWVIVSADDRAHQVLGYSLSGDFDMIAMPCNVSAWLEEYAEQLEYLRQHPALEMKSDGERSIAFPNTSPLILTTWNQGSPYNMRCPIMHNTNALTGCTATALAQIMYYYQAPQRACLAIPAYVTKTEGVNVQALPATIFDWQNMLLYYSGGFSNLNCQAVAKLMRYCGQALCMDYGVNASSAYIELIPYVLPHYFGYDRTNPPHVIERANYSDDEWTQLLCDELSEGHPLAYSGKSATSGSGHTFIVDGYRNGAFHVNWGWGGSYDGFFQLSAFRPSDRDYTLSHTAVFGVRLDRTDVNGDGEVNIADVNSVIDAILSTAPPAYTDVNGDGEVNIADVNVLTNRILKDSGDNSVGEDIL